MKRHAPAHPARRTAGPAVIVLALVAIVVAGCTAHRTAAADGVLPDGATVFDDQYPGVANLRPDLLRAIRAAATDAAADGVRFRVNSGWRSPDYQRRLFAEAVERYGSAAEATRWTATADTSAHVTGEAVDIGPTDAALWLSAHGSDHGLCQTYVNEPWHYELRPEAVDGRCPRMYADASQDPRMQR